MISRVDKAEASGVHRRYFYRLLAHHISFYLPATARVAEIIPRSTHLRRALGSRPITIVSPSETAGFEPSEVTSFEGLRSAPPDRLLLNGCLHFTSDVQDLLENVRALCSTDTRVLLTYYSSLWKPIFTLGSRLGLTDTGPEQN